MKKIILALLCAIVYLPIHAQTASEYYEKGLLEANDGNMVEARRLFTKAITLDSQNVYAWYNRGVTYTFEDRYEDALPNFEQVIKLDSTYKKGWLNRGICKRNLTDYDGAIADYTRAIELDSEYDDAYFCRGLAYEMMNRKLLACADYNKAKDLGMEAAARKAKICEDTTDEEEVHPILRLTKTATDKKYGFSKENPVKVGKGPSGGPANQRAYLNLLRDAKGKRLEYYRNGSCCAYESENGFMGYALLDVYVITYHDEKGKEKQANVYISLYDYEEPMILHGFKTVGQK